MISVITICKNIVIDGREPYLRKMFSSLSRQTYQDFEHIVIDGASNDRTMDILREYEQSGQIDVLISEPDNNAYEALNKGLRIARGEYIYLINSDDYLAINDLFEMSLDVLEKNMFDYTHADRIVLRRDGGPSWVKKGDERVAFFRMPFRHETMLIRKSVYDEIGFFDEKYKLASDYKFILKMILAGKKGYYFPKNFIYSLDGGITANRQLCIEEVTRVLFECYGEKYGLSLADCEKIYLRQIPDDLFRKITTQVTDQRIRSSLELCYELSQLSVLSSVR